MLLFGSLKSRKLPLRSQTGPSVNLKAFGEFEDLWIRRNDRVDRRIFANHFDIHFARRDRDRHDAAFVKLELRLAHVDVIGRRIRERAVDPENRELNLLSRLNAAINDQPIRRIPTFDDGTAALSRARATVSPSTQISA